MVLQLDAVGWGLLKGYPWWPLYVVDPDKISATYKPDDETFQGILARAKESRKTQRLAYYFGSHDFGLHKPTQLKPWLHSQHLAYTKGFPARACQDEQTTVLLTHAVRECTDFLVSDVAGRELPKLTRADYATPGSEAVAPVKPPKVVTIVVDSDDDAAAGSSSPPPSMSTPSDDRRTAAARAPRRNTTAKHVSAEPRKKWLGGPVTLKSVPLNSVCWAKTEVQTDPWLPAFVCDATQLDPDVHDLGRITGRVLEIAELNPHIIRIVFYFGARTFGVIKSKGQIEPWNGANHEAHLKQQWLDDDDLDAFTAGLNDAEAFVAAGASRPYDFEWEYAQEPHDERDVWNEIDDSDHTTDAQNYADSDSSEVEIVEPPSWQPHVVDDVPATKPKAIPPTSTVSMALSPTPVTPIDDETKDDDTTTPSPTQHEPSKRVDDVIVMSRSAKRPCLARNRVDATNLYEYLVIPKVRHTGPPTSNVYVVWAKRKHSPWWPGYVCDPLRLRPNLFLLGDGHTLDQNIAARNQDMFKLVYFFGHHQFGRQHATWQNSLKPWKGPDHEVLVRGPPPVQCDVSDRTKAEFKNAMTEVEAFLASPPAERVLPYMIPSDLDRRMKEPKSPSLPSEGMVWALTKDHPWMPGYLCDPWNSSVKLAGQVPSHLVAAARESYPGCWLVYYFGLHVFKLHNIRGTIKLWDCDEHESLAEGYAEAPVTEDSAWVKFMDAVDEAKAFVEGNSVARDGGIGGSKTALQPFIQPGETHQRVDTNGAMVTWGSSIAVESATDGEGSTHNRVAAMAPSTIPDDFKYSADQLKILQALQDEAKDEGEDDEASDPESDEKGKETESQDQGKETESQDERDAREESDDDPDYSPGSDFSP